jgi:hypothetical protein
MNTLYVWNHEKLISLKGFPSYCFNKATSLKGKFFLPLIRNRTSRFDYDTIGSIITSAKQDPNKKAVHVILLSQNDIFQGSNRDELFDVCSILIENVRNCPNLKLLLIGFFSLPDRFSHQITKPTRFDGKIRLFIKNFPNARYLNCSRVTDRILKLPDASARAEHVEKFYQEILTHISIYE